MKGWGPAARQTFHLRGGVDSDESFPNNIKRNYMMVLLHHGRKDGFTKSPVIGVGCISQC